MARNPVWTRDELILALDLYRRLGQVGPENAEVIALSGLLRGLPLYGEGDGTTYRNASGVAMKLGNFAALDPAEPGVGLTRGGRGDREVWDEYWPDPARLSRTANAIRAAAPDAASLAAAPEEGEAESPEGRLLYRMHVRRERNRSLVAKKKAAALADTGALLCEVCGTDFAVRYGQHGEGFIECHHRVALADAGETRTRLSDLALVCSNCHSMLHYRGNLSVADLSKTLK
jgi:5-methylcytosine-specific restriction protein A